MASSTMINLRNLSPLASSAAVLPQHELRFNIPGVPGVEPSSASVEPTTSTSASNDIVNDDDDDDEHDVAHGVLYKLTEEDFATVCSTEGVPFAYSLHRCRVIPYVGDGTCAGQDALSRATALKKGETAMTAEDGRGSTSGTTSIQSTTTTNDSVGVAAFTLRAARPAWRKQGRDIPPSQSYLNVLLRGAKEFKLDESYVQKLENVKVGRTWIGNGLSEEMLRMAELRNAKR